MSDSSPFLWHELVTPDQMSSGAFFSRLFGWTLKQVPDVGRICVIADPTGAIAHLVQPQPLNRQVQQP